MTKTYYIETELGVLTQRWNSLDEAMDACESLYHRQAETAKFYGVRVYEQPESGPDKLVYGAQLWPSPTPMA